MSTEGELWHIVEAKRDDGTPTMFRIRELDPKKDLTRIFVVELPYSTHEMSRLPNAAAYRRVADLEEQWLRAACQTLGHTIEPLVPSLFTFHIDDARLIGLSGVSVENVVASVGGTKLRESGPLLITHWGLSGPAILKLSG